MAPRILRLQYESQKPEEPLSYKANLIFCVGGGHEEIFCPILSDSRSNSIINLD